MSKFTFRCAEQKISDPLSCFKLVTDKRHLTLSPKFIGNAGAGVREQLSAGLNLYSHSLEGVMIAYRNISRLQSYGTIVGSQPCLHIGIKADFIVFRPEVGSTLNALVNKVFRNHVGCLVHETFNASIPKQCRDGETLFETDLQPGQEILFKVVKVMAKNGILSLEGCFFDGSFDLLPNSQSCETTAPDMDVVDSPFSPKNAQDCSIPTIKSKRKLNESSNMPDLESQGNDTQETSLIHEDFVQEGKKKKGKKKKKDEMENKHDEDNVSNTKREKERNMDAFSTESLADSGIMDTTPTPSDSEKRKQPEPVEPMDVDNNEVLDNIEETQHKVKKKKNKKNKEKREVGEVEGNEVCDINPEEMSQVFDESESAPSEPKKKKKKKHKHSEEIV